MQLTLIKDDNPSPNDDGILQEGIVSSNMAILNERPGHFSIFLKDKNGSIQGGASIWVHTESIYIDILWISENAREKGYGTKLMRAVELEGKRRGCKYSTVDTYSFQAPEFYLKNGYHQLGEIKNHLFMYSKLFFRKELV